MHKFIELCSELVEIQTIVLFILQKVMPTFIRANTNSNIRVVPMIKVMRIAAHGIEAPVRRLNFAYGFRPIYYFSRVCGLMPFSITYDSNGEIQKARVRVFDGLWFVISMCLYLLALHISFQETRKYYMMEPNFLILGDFIPRGMKLFFGCTKIALDMYNRAKLIGILKSFTEFDNEVSARIHDISLKLHVLRKISIFRI